MSMEINGIYGQHKVGYAERIKAEQVQAGKMQEDKEESAGKRPISQDEYVSSEKSVKKCTTNTDKVDREIEKLKEKKQQLEKQIHSASGNEKKVRELERKLARIESELSQKDNDTYRRQNAEIS